MSIFLMVIVAAKARLASAPPGRAFSMSGNATNPELQQSSKR
jgi:hypothetical protein